MSDAELFLMGWAVVATIGYFRAKAEAEIAKKMFMHFIRDEKAREQIVGQWETFKKEHGA